MSSEKIVVGGCRVRRRMGSEAVAWNTDDVVVGDRLLRCRVAAAAADWKTVDAVLGEAARTRAGAGAAKIDDTFVGEAAKERTIAARSTQPPAISWTALGKDPTLAHGWPQIQYSKVSA